MTTPAVTNMQLTTILLAASLITLTLGVEEKSTPPVPRMEPNVSVRSV